MRTLLQEEEMFKCDIEEKIHKLFPREEKVEEKGTEKWCKERKDDEWDELSDL